MTENELKEFQTKYAKSKMKSQADFLIAAIEKNPVIVIEDFAPLLKELKQQGQNQSGC